MCVSWITYMSHTEYTTNMIMNISDSLHCWSAREGACEERLERLCTWIKSLVSFSTCHRDEMIMHLAIAYAVSQRNTFTNHHREVNEIANARRSSTRNVRCEWRTVWILGVWIELHIAHSMWDWDEMIKNTVIVYAIGSQNTFAVHRREVNEIATRVDHLRVTHVAQRRWSEWESRCRLWFRRDRKAI